MQNSGSEKTIKTQDVFFASRASPSAGKVKAK
jgi:hypothetical protein